MKFFQTKFYDISPYDRSNLQNLDSIRGIMALVILSRHFAVTFNVALPQYAWLSPFYIVINSVMGLCYFFVLSGFVISYSQERKQISNTSIGLYAINRYLRLLPPIIVSILLMYVFQANGWLSITSEMVDRSDWLKTLYQFQENNGCLANPLIDIFINSYFKGTVLYNCNLWSITLEFLVPLCIVIVNPLINNKWIRLFLLVVSFGIIILIPLHKFTYGCCMILGMLLCYYLRYAKKIKWFYLIGLLCFLGGNILKQSLLEFKVFFVMNLMSSIFLISYIVKSDSIIVNKVLEWKVLKFLGQISYEIYVFHLFFLFTLAPSIVLIGDNTIFLST